MSSQEPTKFYVYQPDPPRHDGRMYGVSGPISIAPLTMTCKGITKREADAIAEALNIVHGFARNPKCRCDTSACEIHG